MKKDEGLSQKDLEKYRQMLSEEHKLVMTELQEIAVQNPKIKKDWIAKPPSDDAGDNFLDEWDGGNNAAQYEANIKSVNALEVRLNNIDRALTKIKEGTFGFCEVCKKPIEKKRLDANPAARTNIKHKDEEESLQ